MKKILILACAALTLLSCGGGSGNSNAKNGALPGKFSVSNEMQIQFSQGNLQYQASTNTWRFAANQFDTIGAANAMIAADNEGWIDLFAWGSGDNPTKSIADNYQYPDYTEWGSNLISNGGADIPWRTLSYEEWCFLFEKRADAKNKYGVGEVNGVGGMILLPDEWVLPDGLTFKTGMGKGLGTAYNTMNVFTLDEWKKLEKNGAVFLPDTGQRKGTKVSSDCGFYWSSSPSGAYVSHEIFFSPICLSLKSTSGRSYGAAVRLVR